MVEPVPLFGAEFRQPPTNTQAEMAILGALLANNRSFRWCAGLDRKHFADTELADVYEAVREGIQAGKLVDPVSLKERFAPSLLAELLAAMISTGQAVQEYARVVIDCAQRRELIDVCQSTMDAAFEGKSTTAIAMSAVKHIDAIASGATGDRLCTMDSAMDAALADMERTKAGGYVGVSTGFRCFDARLGGLEPGLVYVIGGRPSMGKSSLALSVCLNAARAGMGVLAVSLEMSAVQMGRRALALAAGVPIMTMKTGRLGQGDAERLVVARKELAGLPLTIDDGAGQTPSQIAARAREMKRRGGLGLVMVDHLHLMRPDDQDARHGGTWAVERASGMMLQAAKDCQVPVLLLCQLNRGVEGREDKRPGLSDLRAAGALEQDAYAVGFVYRPEYYLGNGPEDKGRETAERRSERLYEWEQQRAAVEGKAEVIWAKVRDGETGTDHLRFHGPTAAFSEPPLDPGWDASR